MDELAKIKVMIEGDVTQLRKEINDTKNKIDRDASNMGRSFGSKFKSALIAGAGVLSFAKLFNFSLQAKNAARDFEEIRSKFKVVFGDMSDNVEQWAKDLGKSVGRSNADLLKWLGTLQDTFVPLGFARDKASEFSKELTKLAIDVASFSNAADDDVLRDFTSALVGNTETVRKYGVVITEANVKEEAYSSGLAKLGQELSNAAKVQARMNLIMKGTTDAHGDAIRTAGSLANQEKRLRAEFDNTLVTIGNGLVPAFNELIKAGVGWLRIAQKILGIQQQYNTTIEAQDEFFKNLINTTREYREEELKLLQTQLAATMGEIARIQLSLSTRNNSAGGLIQWLFGDSKELKEKSKQLEMLSSALKTQINQIVNFDKELAKRNNKDGTSDLGGGIDSDKQKDAFKKMFEDLKFLADGYSEYRKKLIDEEYQSMLKLTGDTVNAERWKNEQLAQLAEERKAFLTDPLEESMNSEFSFMDGLIEKDEERAQKRLEQELALAEVRRAIEEEDKENRERALGTLLNESNSIGSNLMNAFDLAGDSFIGKMMNALSVVQSIVSILQSAAAISAAISGLTNPLGFLTGFIVPGAHAGGNFVGTPSGIKKMSTGGSFIVPKGFPNDSYPLMVESGERVSVTPASQVLNNDRLLNQVVGRLDVLNMQMVDMQYQKQKIEGNINVYGHLDGRDMFIQNKKNGRVYNRTT
ncbi:MAG: hypothetical protein QY331_10510 [Melioribacteraceae bacterium]|nr:MAG: hypothetical protein QY331_10510 [Melioribacteraceae bacterium]